MCPASGSVHAAVMKPSACVSEVIVACPALAFGTATSITLATMMSAAARTVLLITCVPPRLTPPS